MPTCDDLRLGGTLSGAGITGGLSINNTALVVDDWSGIFGNPGVSYFPFESFGRPGAFLVGDGLPRMRTINLNMRFTRWGPTVYALTEPTEAEQLAANTDSFLALLQAPQYLEVDMPDLSKRFVQVTPVAESLIRQRRRTREMTVPLIASYYWRAGDTQSSQVINGAATLTTAGNVNVYDAVLVFSGDGTFANADAGWNLTITGSGGPVTVDLGARTVTEGGNPADDLLTRTDAAWGWFLPGANDVTSSVSVTVTWRDAFA